MIIDFKEIIKMCPYKIESLIACGGYDGSEAKIYCDAGVKRVTMVEPNPELYEQISKIDGIYAVQAAVSDVSKHNVDFRLCYSLDHTNKGCSSLLKHSL